MFLAAFLLFVAFTLVYLFLASAVIYHLSAYTLPGWTKERVGIVCFVALTLLLYLAAIYFLFQIPRTS